MPVYHLGRGESLDHVKVQVAEEGWSPYGFRGVIGFAHVVTAGAARIRVLALDMPCHVGGAAHFPNPFVEIAADGSTGPKLVANKLDLVPDGDEGLVGNAAAVTVSEAFWIGGVATLGLKR